MVAILIGIGLSILSYSVGILFGNILYRAAMK